MFKRSSIEPASKLQPTIRVIGQWNTTGKTVSKIFSGNGKVLVMAQTLGVSSPNGHGGNNNVAHFEIKLLGFQKDPDSKKIACVIRILGEENYDHDDVVDVCLIVNIFGQQTQKDLFESVI